MSLFHNVTTADHGNMGRSIEGTRQANNTITEALLMLQER
jgi:hypothetical protein